MNSIRILLLSGIFVVVTACSSRDSGSSGTGQNAPTSPKPRQMSMISEADMDIEIVDAQIPECETSRFISALVYTNVGAECILEVTFADGSMAVTPIKIRGNLFGLIEVAYKKISSGSYNIAKKRYSKPFRARDLFGSFKGFSSSTTAPGTTLVAKGKANERVNLSLNLQGFGVGDGVVRLNSLTVEPLEQATN